MKTRDEEVASVILAREASSDVQKKIAAFVESRGCKKINYTIDPAIVGGIIIYIGDVIYDGSVRSRLENIKHSI